MHSTASVTRAAALSSPFGTKVRTVSDGGWSPPSGADSIARAQTKIPRRKLGGPTRASFREQDRREGGGNGEQAAGPPTPAVYDRK